MAGHSKFANIKHRKGKNDAARGRIFTRLGRELAMAVKLGGPDPVANSRLRDAIANAKSENMPNDTIERSIKKAAGDISAVNYEAATYEGYGPGGVAVIVEVLTDNRNRAASGVRHAFTKGGGSLGAQGCVSFLFDEIGQILVERGALSAQWGEDELMMLTADAGAQDFLSSEEGFEIVTAPGDFSAVREALQDAGIPVVHAEIIKKPQTWVSLTEPEHLKQMNKMLNLLDDDDDVQSIYHNYNEQSEEEPQ
ncbi:MAG: YebC/PmpR family DNA-binding transcriptional regulator [Defluviitaleaceae bacterium]|nr:YebC/PmpR family DNA-binding transcriptional regulator [Defluviitaleaceae bacterium]MCL2240256.1 YebC/PmpR family DNA-binding transcriptional regulator [Defluviitaleaceae bacterium]